jgi:hypothetical protein
MKYRIVKLASLEYIVESKGRGYKDENQWYDVFSPIRYYTTMEEAKNVVKNFIEKRNEEERIAACNRLKEKNRAEILEVIYIEDE